MTTDKLPDLGLGESHGYAPSEWFALRDALRHIPIDRSDTFVDVGCGKGKAMVIASHFSFGAIVGIEKSAVLASIARKNVKRFPRCSVLIEDATTLPFCDDATVVYLFNPFPEKSFAEFLNRMGESMVRRPREIVFLYACPAHSDLLLESKMFSVRCAQHFQRGNIASYTIHPGKIDSNLTNGKNCPPANLGDLPTNKAGPL